MCMWKSEQTRLHPPLGLDTAADVLDLDSKGQGSQSHCEWQTLSMVIDIRQYVKSGTIGLHNCHSKKHNNCHLRNEDTNACESSFDWPPCYDLVSVENGIKQKPKPTTM